MEILNFDDIECITILESDEIKIYSEFGRFVQNNKLIKIYCQDIPFICKNDYSHQKIQSSYLMATILYVIHGKEVASYLHSLSHICIRNVF